MINSSQQSRRDTRLPLPLLRFVRTEFVAAPRVKLRLSYVAQTYVKVCGILRYIAYIAARLRRN